MRFSPIISFLTPRFSITTLFSYGIFYSSGKKQIFLLSFSFFSIYLTPVQPATPVGGTVHIKQLIVVPRTGFYVLDISYCRSTVHSLFMIILVLYTS